MPTSSNPCADANAAGINVRPLPFGFPDFNNKLNHSKHMQRILAGPISKKTLIMASIVADAVDVLLLVGISPGPWSVITEAPVSVMHFMYAGPRAVAVLTEFIPFAGFLPIYTIAALLYPTPVKPAPVIDVRPVPPVVPHPPALPYRHE